MQTIKRHRTILANIWTFYSRLVYGTPPLRTVFAADYLHLRAIHRFVNESLAKLPNGRSVLDVGCGDQRYRKILPIGVAYVGLDYKPTKQKFYNRKPYPDIFGDAQAMPVKSNSFDCILCTEVLEHVSDITRSLADMVRILKPEGQMILTVPFLFPEHNSPYDFHRHTVHGIKFECERAGLRVERIVKLGGVGTMLAGLLARVCKNLMMSRAVGKILFYFPGLFVLPLLHFILNMTGCLLDRIPLSPFYIGAGLICRRLDMT